MLIGAISDTVHAKAERFNRDTTRKYENQTSEQVRWSVLGQSPWEVVLESQRKRAARHPLQADSSWSACEPRC
jgi:hypothetical protein